MKSRSIGSISKKGLNSMGANTHIARVPQRYETSQRPFADNYICLYKKFFKEAKQAGMSSGDAKRHARDLANAELNKFPNMV